MRIGEALAQAHERGVDRLDAQYLLVALLARPRAWLAAHADAELPAAQADAFRDALARRRGGEPLAYVLGEAEFCGLRLRVTPAVLIPRPETEDLVRWARERLSAAPAASVVDLGTGSGAIALALARSVPDAAVTATDASGPALEVARENAHRHGQQVEFLHGDWWAPLAGRRFGLAVSNPPYVAAGDPHLAALGHEPQSALTPGGDGLSALQALIDAAPAHLLPGAWLLLEHGHDQADAVQRRLRERGFANVQTRADLAGLPRCTGGAWHAWGSVHNTTN